MKKTTKRIVIGVAAFVAVICGLSSLVVTKENEYTLIMRFGKISSIKTRGRIKLQGSVFRQRTNTSKGNSFV